MNELILKSIKEVSHIWHKALYSLGDRWDIEHPFLCIYYTISMKLLSRNYSRKTTVSKLSTQRRANPVQLYSAVGSKAQGPILPVQRLLPLSHHFFVDQLVKGEG